MSKAIEEEAEMFPRLRTALDPVELREMAAALDAARSEAPSHTGPDGGVEVTEHDGRRVVIRTPTAGEEDAARIESGVQREGDAEVTRHPTLRA